MLVKISKSKIGNADEKDLNDLSRRLTVVEQQLKEYK